MFDELHFSKFMDRVLTGTWFFDIHPPLGKLILAYGSAMFGYVPDRTFVIEKIGMQYPATVKFLIPRIISASFSTVTVPLTYLVARRLTISQPSAVLAGVMVGTDFLGIIEGRLILMDSQLLAFCQLSLICALELWRTPRTEKKKHFMLLTATGLMSGVALSIKHTALGTPGLIAVISFFGTVFLDEPLRIWECLYAAGVGIAFHAWTFYIMFNTLTHSGGKYDNFMQTNFQQTLIGNKLYNPSIKRQPFWKLFGYLNFRMVASNAAIKKRHSWESTYYQWVCNWRGVLYYVKTLEDGRSERIYLFGNPAVLWVVLFVVFVFSVFGVCMLRYRKEFFSGKRGRELQHSYAICGFLLAGWLCNLLPYMLVDRAAFIYHYIPGLFYGQLLTAASFDLLPRRTKYTLIVVFGTLMVTALVYWAPFIYSLPLTRDELSRRRWLPRWN